MAFKGWPPSALDFFEGLEADNCKGYWTEHKKTYEQDVRAPMEALIAELADEFGEGRIFRPNRDIRFSADKTPYKTNIAAMAGDGYLHLSADELMVGSGMYHMMPDQLERYRRAVATDRTGSELEEIIRRLRKAKLDVHGTDPLKTAPKGYPKDHPRIDLLRNKGLVAMKQWPAAAWMGTAAAKTKIVSVLREAKPLRVWLEDNVGDSTMEMRPR
jgi:uncharacterized protein (TIGR02453 family)